MGNTFIFDFEQFKTSKPAEVLRIYDHVAQVTVNKEYYNRGRDQTDPARNMLKNLIGKIAEYATYAFIYYSATSMVTKPDLKIYEFGDAGNDITCTGVTGIYNLHVKSCSIDSQNEFGDAWLFRKGEKLVDSPKQNDLIILTKELPENKIEIVKIVRAVDMLMSYTQPFTSKGFPISKKWKLSYDDIRFEKDFNII